MLRLKGFIPNRVIKRSVVLAIAFSLLPFSTSPSSATPCYVVVGGVLTDGSACSGDVVIEEGITAIGQVIGGDRDQYGAFQDIGITSVTIPSTVTQIRYGAFWGSSLSSVTFAPDSNLVTIGEFAFAGTQNLRDINLPSTLNLISSIAFNQSGILYIVFEGPAPGIANYNGPGDLQGVSSSAIAWVKPSNLASFDAVTPKILPTVRSISGSTPPPTIFWPSDNETLTATVGTLFSDSITFVGAGNPVLEVSAGSLPPGITLNATTGVISGTPTTIMPLITRNYSASLTVRDGSESDSVAITFEVLPPPLPQISSATFTGIAGVPMNKSFFVFPSGTGTVTLSQGSLPPGVSISGSNRLTGTPVTTGTYTARLKVTDSYSQEATSNDFIFEISPTVSVNISASLQVMNSSTSPDQPLRSMISTNAPDAFIICGFYRDAGVLGSTYFSDGCYPKQWSSHIASGITSDVAYTEFDNTTWVIRVFGPDALEDGIPDMNTPFLATVTVIVGQEAQPSPSSTPAATTSPTPTTAPSSNAPAAVASKPTTRSSKAIQFSTRSSLLSKANKSALKKSVAMSGKKATYVVTGTAGFLPGVTETQVKKLATVRANVVKAYLVKLGVNKVNITIKIKTTNQGIAPKTKILAKYLDRI